MSSKRQPFLRRHQCVHSPAVLRKIIQYDSIWRQSQFILPLILAISLVCLSCSKPPTYPSAPQIGQNIVIDTTNLPHGEPRFYTYRFQGKNINYFILNLQGRVSSFLDACTSCYLYKQGYRCENDSIVCRHCDLKFSVYKLEKGLGSCFPIKIEGRLENGQYFIPLAALEVESSKF